MPVVRVTGANLALLDSVAEDVFDAAIERARAADWLAVPDAILLVALAGDLVVGQLAGIIVGHPDAPSELYIDNLGVAPGWRRRGIATGLVDAAMQAARDAGCSMVWVLTDAGDANAEQFYAAVGLSGAPVTLHSAAL